MEVQKAKWRYEAARGQIGPRWTLDLGPGARTTVVVRRYETLRLPGEPTPNEHLVRHIAALLSNGSNLVTFDLEAKRGQAVLAEALVKAAAFLRSHLDDIEAHVNPNKGRFFYSNGNFVFEPTDAKTAFAVEDGGPLP